jgi:hypothetical protein
MFACLIGPVVQEGPGDAGDEVESEAVDRQAVSSRHGDDVVHVGSIFVEVAEEELKDDLKLQAAVGFTPAVGFEARPLGGVASPELFSQGSSIR